MATRRSVAPLAPPPARLTPPAMRAGIDRLQKRIEEVDHFDPTTVTDQHDIPNVKALSASIDDALVRTFGADTLEYKRCKDASHFNNGQFNYIYEVPIQDVHQSLSRSKARNLALLRQAVGSLEEQLAESDAVPAVTPPATPRYAHNRKIFIVHGRDEGPREALARFLERLGFNPIILHEQANQGRTVIEKVEDYSDVGFAVVILTPDDEGGLKGNDLQPRARQNVLLELGYFIGKLTRRRVCTLTVGELEIPSDWRGVVDESYNASGGWRQTLARELEAATYEIDWNKVMRP